MTPKCGNLAQVGEHKLVSARAIFRFGVLGVVGSIFLILIVVVVLALHKSPPPEVHVDPAAAARVNSELKQAQADATPSSPQILRVGQTELNSVAASYLGLPSNPAESSAPSSVRDLKLTLSQDRVRLYLMVNFHGKDTTFELEGKLRTVNGYADFMPLSGRMGALPVPKALLQSSMRRMMESPEARQALRLPGNLSDIHVEDSKIVATFK